MNKFLYVALFATAGTHLSGCSETTSDGELNAEESAAFIVRDTVNNRITTSADGSTNSALFGHEMLDPSHVRGARIYDDFLIELAATPPGANPLAGLAAEGVAADEWRCSGCHGFDYEGVSTFNGADVNLQDLIPVRQRDEEYVIHMLSDGFLLSDGSMVHSYANILTPQAMVDVADFVVNEIYDTHEFLSAVTGVGFGDVAAGMDMWQNDLAPLPTGVPAYIRADGTAFNCVMCHDGANTTDLAALKAIAVADPFKFLHRINFGSPRDVNTLGFGYGDTMVMPGLYELVLTDGLHFGGPEQAGAVMRYIQTP